MKKLALTAASILFIVGCGSGSSSSDTTAQTTSLPTPVETVTVERGPVLHAVVIDSQGQMAREAGNGQYQFYKQPVYPIIATGGFIDVNRDGIVDAGDVNNTLTYYTKDGKAVTIVSAIAENPDIRNYLKETYSLTDDQIDNDLPQNDDTIAAISDAVYAYCVENNISDPKTLTLNDIESLNSKVQTQLQTYKENPNRAEVEAELIKNLGIKPLDQTEIDQLQTTGYANQNVINLLPKYNLTDEDKQALAHMWNEEKLAHDVYLKLYELYPNLNTLYTIATQAEATHESMVQSLLEKYNLDITSPDYNGTYNPEALAQYGIGEFIIPEIQDLYNQLYALGSQSQIDALKVGCMVEVTDINDLDKYLDDGQSTPDMLLVFDNLRNGSYHHYWAFDRALKNLGVSEGCCSAGEEYCKTPEEYPTTNFGNDTFMQQNYMAGGYQGGR